MSLACARTARGLNSIPPTIRMSKMALARCVRSLRSRRHSIQHVYCPRFAEKLSESRKSYYVCKLIERELTVLFEFWLVDAALRTSGRVKFIIRSEFTFNGCILPRSAAKWLISILRFAYPYNVCIISILAHARRL